LRHGFFDTYTMPTSTYVLHNYNEMHEYAMIFDDIYNNRIVNSSTEFDDDGTVHLTLHNLLGEPVSTAHVNYVAVDANGNSTGGHGRVNASADGKVAVPFNDVVSDKETGSLYMEVVADGYEPRFYKYNIKDQTYRHPFISLPSNEVDLVMETSEQTTTQFCRADLWCFPDNKDNPYSDNFELGPSIFGSRTMGSRGWKKVKPRRVVGAGNMLMNDVTGIASPSIFNHSSSLIYNKLNKPGDYNDDRLMMFDLSTKHDADINTAATGAAFNFDVDERGDKCIVAFEQYNSGDLTKAEVEGCEESIDDQNSMSQNVGVQASLWDGSGWQTTKLSSDDVANLSPRAAVQADGIH